jgi:hypothetical protein
MFKKIKEKVLGLFGKKENVHKKGCFRRLNEEEILDMLGKETCYNLPVFANGEKIGEMFVPTNAKKDNAINLTHQHKAISSKLTHLVTRSNGTIKKSTFNFVPGERLDIFIEQNNEKEVLSQDNFDKDLIHAFGGKMQLSQLFKLIDEFGGKLYKENDIRLFLEGETGYDNIGVDGIIYSRHKEEDLIKLKELLKQHQKIVLELGEIEI